MFECAAPMLWLLLPLPLVVYFLLKPVQTSNSAALNVPFFSTLTHYLGRQSGLPRQLGWRQIVASIIWLLLVFAASGPQWLGDPLALPRDGRNVILAVDISGSMQTPDLVEHKQTLTRLDVVKRVAHDFVENRLGDKLGLIVFGSRAYLQTPLTFDRKTVQAMLADATVGLAGPQTAIGDAIGLAIKRLAKQPKGSRMLILLTDGVNNAGNVLPIAAAKQAADIGLKIYTVGLGAKQMVLPGFFGSRTINPSQDLDEASLKKIAKLTGGKYFRATDKTSLRQAYQAIDQLEPTKSQTKMYRPITAWYQWPLGLALILSVILVSSRLSWQRLDTVKVNQ